MDSAVSAVAVATTSSFVAALLRRQVAGKRSTNASPYSSRPQLLGGSDEEIVLAEKRVDDVSKYVAAFGYGSVAVELFVEELCHAGVDDHVGGTGVEGHDVVDGGARGNYGHVCDAAQILQHSADFG